jgi:hypothetical protein
MLAVFAGKSRSSGGDTRTSLHIHKKIFKLLNSRGDPHVTSDMPCID